MLSKEVAAAQEVAARSVHHDCPPVVGVAGNPGLGKTVDCVYSFPMALFIAAPGAVKSGVTTTGWAPRVEYADDLDGIAKTVEKHIASTDPKKRREVVIDDFGAAVASTELAMSTQVRDGRAMYKQLYVKVRRLLEQFRDWNVLVALSTHRKEPKPASPDGPGHAGGPGLPGALMTQVPAITDLWANMHVDPARRPHPVSYAAGMCPQGGQGTRDRHNVCGERSPANLGELLRCAGWYPQRPPGMEWYDEAIERLAGVVLSNQSTLQDAAKYAVEQLRGRGAQPWQIRWFIRDLVDRVEIRTAKAKREAEAFAFLGFTI